MRRRVVRGFRTNKKVRIHRVAELLEGAVWDPLKPPIGFRRREERKTEKPKFFCSCKHSRCMDAQPLPPLRAKTHKHQSLLNEGMDFSIDGPLARRRRNPPTLWMFS